MVDDTQLHHRVGVTRAALLDMGRDDLAERIWDADVTIEGGSTAVTWWAVPSGDDRVLLFRAAAIASLSTGFDHRSLPCETCVRALVPNYNCPDKVTRSEFVARSKMCDAHSNG